MKDADIIGAEEVAALLGLNRKTVYQAAQRGQLPCRRVGRRLLFSRQAVDAWLRRPLPPLASGEPAMAESWGAPSGGK